MRLEDHPNQDLWFLNTHVRIRVAHTDGSDGISVIENWAPYGDSPPLHIHHSEDELFQVVEGEFKFVVGGKEMRAGPGDVVLTPKGVAHTYRVESTDGGRWIVVTTRGDFERFVRELSRPATAPELPVPAGPPGPQEVQALAEVAMHHHIELIGAPLG